MARPVKQYHLHGIAGLAYRHKVRSTGTFVGIYRADQSDLDDEDGELPWVTVCEDHGSVLNHSSLGRAKAHAPHPEEWCEYCQEKNNG